jgi:hypothetical protein
MAGGGKDAIATYGIDVQTGESTDEVGLLARSLQDLREAMRADKSELEGMNKALANLKRGGEAFEDQAKALKVQIDAKGQSLAVATDKYQLLGGKLTDITKKAGGAKSGFAALKQQLDEANHKLTDVGKKIEKPTQELSAMSQVFAKLQERVANSNGVMGQSTSFLMKLWKEVDAAKLRVVGLAVAFFTVTGAMIAFTKHMYEGAVAAQDARRGEYLHLEALTRKRNMYGLVANNAREMQETIDRVSASVSINRGEVAALAEQLDRGGMRGKNFGVVLEAASVKASALGSAAGTAFAGFANDVRLAGGSAARAAQDVKNRFGDVVQAKMELLSVQAIKSKENYDSLFRGVDTKPLAKAQKALNDMTSQSTASGRVFQTLTTQFLQPIVNLAEKSLVVMRRFFKQMLIGVNDLVIGYLTVRVWFHKTFGGPEVASVWGKFFTMFRPGIVVVGLLAGAFIALGVSIVAAFWPFILGAVAIWGFFTAVSLVWAAITEIDWSGIFDGIWKAIKALVLAVPKVMGELADSLANAFSSALEIHSPSKVFAKLGLEIPAGVAQGIKQGTPAAQSAADGVVERPLVLPPTAAPTGGATNAVARGNTTNTITIHVDAGGDKNKAQDIARAIRRELESVLGGIAEQIGAPRGEPRIDV